MTNDRRSMADFLVGNGNPEDWRVNLLCEYNGVLSKMKHKWRSHLWGLADEHYLFETSDGCPYRAAGHEDDVHFIDGWFVTNDGYHCRLSKEEHQKLADALIVCYESIIKGDKKKALSSKRKFEKLYDKSDWHEGLSYPFDGIYGHCSVCDKEDKIECGECGKTVYISKDETFEAEICKQCAKEQGFDEE